VASYKAALKINPESKAISRDLDKCCCAFYRSLGRKVDLKLVKLLVRSANLHLSRTKPGVPGRFVADFIKLFERSDADPTLLFFFDDALMSVSECIDPIVFEDLRRCLVSVSQLAAARDFDGHELIALGRVLYKYELIPKCREIFELALANAGPNALAYYYLGACFEIESDLERSLLNYTRALRMDDNEDTRTGIRRVQARMKSLD